MTEILARNVERKEEEVNIRGKEKEEKAAMVKIKEWLEKRANRERIHFKA